ncbi:hypothetical protein EV215_0856 [Hypnocyclicus thermotrophus]|uniref:Uncharacterized protein n=1 Tax=Hypnocyclicus thermotrophus TaxID=1627895 RepID=A0AA46DZ67_9FUSO|nr:hypothetical protein [Hypnocyclicus thermotrophus]TDT71480.1 hypothetical protein EV215_0856 [Hypnocyclicus thermotrophus]
MSSQYSFIQYEKNYQHQFRNKLNNAEEPVEVLKIFSQIISLMLNEIFEEEIKVEYEDIKLLPNDDTEYKISDKLLSNPKVNEIFNNSDIKNIIFRFSNTAIHKYRSLNKHNEKTKLKIRN